MSLDCTDGKSLDCASNRDAESDSKGNAQLPYRECLGAAICGEGRFYSEAKVRQSSSAVEVRQAKMSVHDSLRTAAILSACKGTESGEYHQTPTRPHETDHHGLLDVMSWSVSAEGYSERTTKVLRSIKSQRAWQKVCSGDIMSSDEDDNEEAETLEQIRQRIIMALK